MTGGGAARGSALLRVALGEYDTGWHSPEDSLTSAESLTADAAGCGARLVVLPEMATTGFTMDPAQAAGLHARPVRRLREMATRHGVWIIAGVALAEPAAAAGTPDGCVVNAALAITPDGRVEAVHRKQRLFAFAGEHAVYTPGAASTIITVEGVRIGLFICYELRFPEVFAAVADQVECMVLIANWPAARRAHWDTLLRARAIENQCAVLGVNRTGTGGGIEYDGGSAAYDAWGEPLAPDPACPVPVVAVDPAHAASVRGAYPFLKDRRP